MNIVIDNQDTKLFSTVQPNNGKDSVILLHGGPGVPNGLTFMTEYLARHFQVISFHQRGTRKSPCLSNNYSLEGYISDIDRIADYFKLKKFHLFGHSWGGLYAQIYAYKNPDKLLSLFLCSPVSGTGRQYTDNLLEIARYNKAKCSLPEWVAMNINSGLGILGFDKGYKNFFRQALENFSRGFSESCTEQFEINCIKAKTINQTIKSVLKYSLPPALIDTNYKTTITYGDQDIINESKKYVIQRYPKAIAIIIPASGHIPWSHNKKAFVKVLAEHYGI